MNLIKIKNNDIQFTAIMLKSEIPDNAGANNKNKQSYSVIVALNTCDIDQLSVVSYTNANRAWNATFSLMYNNLVLQYEAICLKTSIVAADILCMKFEFMPSSDFKPIFFAKNLFIPLNTEYFQQFKSKQKKHELRRYGKRWNEKTCVVGRPATLSHGYGKKNRLAARVIDFNVVSAAQLTAAEAGAFFSIYKTLDCEIAKISLRLKS